MRLMLLAFFCAGMLTAGCSFPKPEANPMTYIDYRSTTDLQERLAALDRLTEAYVKKGPPNKLTNRRELGSLSDEISANYLREKIQIERELAKRYKAGDQKAHFEGIENVPVQ